MSASSSARLLVCYDGSDHAKEAIKQAAGLFPGAHADIISIRVLGWTQPISGDPAWPLHSGEVSPDVQAMRDDALALATQGAEMATELGLVASPIGTTTPVSIWAEVVDRTNNDEYSAIVLGSRGRTRFKTALLGSVSMGVVTHASVPVIVVHHDE